VFTRGRKNTGEKRREDKTDEKRREEKRRKEKRRRREEKRRKTRRDETKDGKRFNFKSKKLVSFVTHHYLASREPRCRLTLDELNDSLFCWPCCWYLN
jgi:hypothetical protein